MGAAALTDFFESPMTTHLVQQGLLSFEMGSIAGVFIAQQVEDHRSMRRHMLAVTAGVSGRAYYAAQVTLDMLVYLVLVAPSFILTVAGFQAQGAYVSYENLVLVDLQTKVVFPFVLLPLVYILGFILRGSVNNLFKTVNLLNYLGGYLFTMCVLAVETDTVVISENRP